MEDTAEALPETLGLLRADGDAFAATLRRSLCSLEG